MEKAKRCLELMEFLGDWTTWRKNLGEALRVGKQVGMSDEEIHAAAVKIGDFLAEKVCPATKEEELLKEMWEVGTPEERRAIASMLIKMVG